LKAIPVTAVPRGTTLLILRDPGYGIPAY
jgi:hypothetical protein